MLLQRREPSMSLPRDDAAVLSARWTEGVLLKRDVFSTVERGRFRSDAGEVDAVLRRLDQVPWWSYIPARHLFGRERHALALARDLHVGPELLWAGRQALVRGFINGVALPLAKPVGEVACGGELSGIGSDRRSNRIRRVIAHAAHPRTP